MIGELQRFKAEYLKALAHPVRISILEVLRVSELPVAEIHAQVDPAVANISQHLAVLRTARIVVARKTGPSVLYSVGDPTVFVLLDALRQIFTARLDSMQTILATEGQEPTSPDTAPPPPGPLEENANA